MKRARRIAYGILARGFSDDWLRVHRGLLTELSGEWQRWQMQRNANGESGFDEGDDHAIAQALVGWLPGFIRGHQQQLDEVLSTQNRFISDFDRSHSFDEQSRLILDCLRVLGRSRRQLAGDRKALKRWLDRDAVIDHCLQRRAHHEQRLAFALGRLGVVAATVVEDELAREADPNPLWHRLNLEGLLRDMLSHEGDQRVALAAFHALTAILRRFPSHAAEGLVEEPTLRYIYRSALEMKQDVWIQAEALSILEVLSPPSMVIALKHRIEKPQTGDDLFVRRRAAAMVVRHLQRHPELSALLEPLCKDTSPFVRQGLTEALGTSPYSESIALLTRLLRDDGEPSVRGAAALALVEQVALLPEPQPALRPLLEALDREPNPWVLRTLLHGIVTANRPLQHQTAAQHQELLQQSQAALSQCAAAAHPVRVRRWAAQAAEQLWLFSTPPEIQHLAQALQQLVQSIPPGGSAPIPKPMMQVLAQAPLGRLLSLLAQGDFPLEVDQRRGRYRIYRGHRHRFRWWRVLHEWRHTSPDKRQAFSHMSGRHFRGQIRAPSTILNEMSPTKVPGEPLHIEQEGGWRPYLPLVDDLISTLDQGRTARLHSSQGVTEIKPPRRTWRRMRALWLLTKDFADYAALRNYQSEASATPGAYIERLAEMGFEIRFYPHYRDPEVGRFFAIAPGIPLIDPEMAHRFEKYFFSAYENSIFELILFTSAALALFLGRHLWLGLRMWYSRARIPLVIGGWGTRGKSGTERLKAAVFHARGVGMVSKTTGCEAMFIHAPAFMAAREMFLFRPYDKATIWEQHNLVTLAEDMGCQVFLWECMALTPSYVQLLQRSWVKDDLSTITNAYPDHEDLQGPAGVNIPEVIAQFIPKRARVISSEEQMAPILRVEAERVGTRMDQVGWLEAGLLTPDILERFPYAEHPNNIALVVRLCQTLNLPVDESLKAMADHVIPDIGVLKSYPKARIQGRWLSFVNGMSANERLGCLDNWQRSGFAQQDPRVEPEVWISTVVNNRADRVARTRVFARLLVHDIQADRHLLIGGNLEGLLGDIEEELDSWLAHQSLQSERRTPQQTLEQQALRMRIPTDSKALQERLRAMLLGAGVANDQAQAWCELWGDRDALRAELERCELEQREEFLQWTDYLTQQQQAYAALQQALASEAASAEEFDARYRQQLRHWFMQRIVVMHDYHASGNQIIERLAQQTPPGLHNRIMGMQNIKGTGLDFVYRWQAWDQCQQACEDILCGQPVRFREGLRRLSDFRDFGPLSASLVRTTVDEVRKLPEAQAEKTQAALSLILSNLERALEQHHNEAAETQHTSGWLEWMINGIEAFLDAGDAIKRRKLANQIYRDLKDGRISRQRASDLLGDLIKRQKGGWLKKRVANLF